MIELDNGAFARRPEYNEDNPVRNLKYLTIPKTVRLCWDFLGKQSGFYTEITLKGYEGSVAHKYWQKHYSHSKKIKREIIDGTEEDAEREFILGRDNNSFYHLRLENKESGFFGTNGLYLTDEDYDKLV